MAVRRRAGRAVYFRRGGNFERSGPRGGNPERSGPRGGGFGTISCVFRPEMPPRGTNSPKLPPRARAGFDPTPHTPNSGPQPQNSGPQAPNSGLLAPSSVVLARFGGGCRRVLPKSHRRSSLVQWRFPDSVGISRRNQRKSTPSERPFGGGFPIGWRFPSLGGGWSAT